MDVAKLQREIAALVAKMQELNAKEDWDPENDQAEYDRLHEKVKALKARIQSYRDSQDLLGGDVAEGAAAAAAAAGGDGQLGRLGTGGASESQFNNAFQAAEALALRGVVDRPAAHDNWVGAYAVAAGVSRDESEMIAMQLYEQFADWLTGGQRKRKNPAARQILNQNVNNPLQVSTDAAGGNYVPVVIMNRIIETMKSFGGMREYATVETMMGINQFSIPTFDPTGKASTIVDENADPGALALATGVNTINWDRWTTGILPVSLRWLEVAAVDGMMAYLERILGMVMARGQAFAFTRGVEPDGTAFPDNKNFRTLLPGPGDYANDTIAVGRTGADGQTLTVLYDDLSILRRKLDPSYDAGNSRFMMNNSSAGVVERIKDGQGRPQFLPSAREGEPDRVLNRPVAVNQAFPDMAANAYSIAYGDMSAYHIWDAGMVMLQHNDSPYSSKGLVGLQMDMWSAAKLAQRDTAWMYRNSAT